MNALDLARTALANTFRSKLRTTLTVLALVVGALTLTTTTALGAGVSNYLETQVATLGSNDVVLVSAAVDPADAAATDEGPAPWEGESSSASTGTPPGFTAAVALSDDDLAAIAAVDGVERVESVQLVSTDFVASVADPDSRYEFSINPQSAVTRSDVVAGEQLDHSSSAFEVMLPLEYVEPLGFADAEDAVGSAVMIAITDLTGVQHEVEATVAGVSRASLLSTGAGANSALITELAETRTAGLEGATSRSTVAIAYLANGSDAEALQGVSDRLADAGYTAQTVEDQLGVVQTIILGITGVLNAFGVIALLAAAFGIVNTLLMSVQERTREIGLMKAMGMSSPRVFTLFSLEAIVIGLLGSGIGVLLAVGIGTALSGTLATGLLADLDGLTILTFEPSGVIGVIALITVIAFIAGTLPAYRAARQRPIDALRYE